MLRIIFACLLLTGFAFAEEIKVDSIIVSTPHYSVNSADFKPELGIYEYEVSWSGIPAATAYLTVAKDGLNYKVSTKVKTASAIDLFYELRYEAEGVISGVDFYPLKTNITQQENSRHKTTSIKYSPDGNVWAVHRSSTKKEPVEYFFNPENTMLEPFSAAFIARSLDWEPGITRYFDTFNGNSRYLISFTALNKINMDVNGQTREVWVIEPKVKKLNTDDYGKGKLRTAKIYITADEKREILKISSEVFIGSVNTKLESFTPLKGKGAAMAQVKRVNYSF